MIRLARLPISFVNDPHEFANRHLGTRGEDAEALAREVGYSSVESLIGAVVPESIRLRTPLALPPGLPESGALQRLEAHMGQNQTPQPLIGLGYHDCLIPPVIQRCILENPGWYTAYTPYQAEIAQGRLELLLAFQTMVASLTGLDVANASLLDEGTAAAEAMAIASAQSPSGTRMLVDAGCHPQTIDVLRTRANPLGIKIEVAALSQHDFDAEGKDLLAVLLSYPATDGSIRDLEKTAQAVRKAGGLVIVATDLLALTLLKPPGEWGADIAVGSAQRLGVPLGFGGPHAAFMACRDALKRRLPGRLVGVSIDADGQPAMRLALQTREQHIRREKATSNICTAQVLLAVMAAAYAIYHGPGGLRAIAQKIHRHTEQLAARLLAGGFNLVSEIFFDTVQIQVEAPLRASLLERAREAGFLLREDIEGVIGISLDECCDDSTVECLAEVFSLPTTDGAQPNLAGFPSGLVRTSTFLTQEIFHRHHTEHEMLRFLRRLEGKDLALNWSMIPLGSCTMKLNPAAAMMPLSWKTVGGLHPFAPPAQTTGYASMIAELKAWLSEITGFPGISLQPNAGSQGEYAGLLAIRRWQVARGEAKRNICLIPTSAHGTNPASAVMAGFQVVAVKCDEMGNVDLEDVAAKTTQYEDTLGALMVTYPSTHGVFEESIGEICRLVHGQGGQVYMDGANMNAQVGLCRPGNIGADVCHLNLHKTFAIPHGGGGPGVGPTCVAEHLAPYLPGHRFATSPGVEAVASAPEGSASILTISWMYIALMGGPGLTEATKLAIVNANYIAHRLSPYFPVLYRGENGLVAHECILDFRPIKTTSGVEVEDVAKRLMDYGFHAPTMSWPVPGTLMVEPTESESREELDRFCDALISIHGEISDIAEGRADRQNNLLKNAPHPAHRLVQDPWPHPYTREEAVYPTPWTKATKFWPPVARIDNVHGDRHLHCTCDAVEAYAAQTKPA